MCNIYDSCLDFVSRLGSPTCDDLLDTSIPDYVHSPAAVNIVASAVSLPERAGTARLMDLLPPEVATRYASPVSLLRPIEERASAPRAVLFGSRDEYVELIMRMVSADMIDFTTQPVVVNGIFATPKSDGLQRLIIDARRANAIFVDPPAVKLPTPDLVAKIEVPSHLELFVAKCDIDNFYHRLLLPDWLRPYFALPPIRAEEVGLGQVFGEGTTIFPCCKTLPMGWSHAVYLGQTAHEWILDSHTSLRRVDRISTGSDARVDRIRHQIYIDDLSLVGTNKQLMTELQTQYAATMESLGLSPKKSKFVAPSSEGVECLGLEINGKTHTYGLTPSKLRRLMQMTASLLDTGESSGDSLAVLVGKWSWVCLVCRPAFAIFNSVYRFISVCGTWPCVHSLALCAQ